MWRWLAIHKKERYGDAHLTTAENQTLLRWGNTRLFLDLLLDPRDLQHIRRLELVTTIWQRAYLIIGVDIELDLFSNLTLSISRASQRAISQDEMAYLLASQRLQQHFNSRAKDR